MNFLAKKSTNFENFQKFYIEFDKTQRNICLVPPNFSSFGAFLDILWLFQDPFWATFQTYTHVAYISQERPLLVIQHNIYRIEDEELFFTMMMKLKRFEKYGPPPIRALNLN